MSLAVSIVSIVLSVSAIIFTYLNFIQTKKDAFRSLSEFLIEQKESFINSIKDTYSISDEDIKTYMQRELASNYCNAYEHACGLYLNNAIDKELFKNVFRDEILLIVNGEGVAEPVANLLKGDARIYENIKKVGKEFHE